MQNLTISEKLLFSTVRLINSTGDIGTGFFFDYHIPGNKSVRVLVTNKHVINSNQVERICL